MFENIKEIGVKIFSKISASYIEYVFKTSKVVLSGDLEYYNSINESKDKYVICFWHGDSYCYYPLFKNMEVFVITTITSRGAYISDIARRFGYIPIRVPDDSNGDSGTFNLKDVISKIRKSHVAITLDGPSGPYHEPKKFPIVTSLITKKEIFLLSVKAEKKIQLKRRWDKFIIPLPYNTIEFTFHKPFAVTKEQLEDTSGKIINIMERA